MRRESYRTWRNWARTQAITPARVAYVGTTGDVVDAIAAARRDGLRVKAVGSGHSFSGIALAPGVQLDLTHMTGLIAVDAAARTATLAAGTPLHVVPRLLGAHGLAMENLGDIDRQTISGAIATGTHGTGGGFGGLSTQVTGLTLVDGRGDVRRLGAGDPDLASAAVGLGALGVVTEVTLRLVPSFAVRRDERARPADEAIDSFLDDVRDNDHYEFFWFPHTDVALASFGTRLPASTPQERPGRLRRYVDEELVSNHALRALSEIGARFPAVTPRLNRFAASVVSDGTVTDASHTVYAHDRNVRFREMEYAIALADMPEALRRLRALVAEGGWRVSFPVEVRAAAADDLALSTASGRATGYIAVHRYHRDPVDDYFARVEELLFGMGGRPHWGKMHTRTAGDLRAAYPRFDEFAGVRERFDPDRTFGNDYLAHVLGD